jgi:hypothetical protein
MFTIVSLFYSDDVFRPLPHYSWSSCKKLLLLALLSGQHYSWSSCKKLLLLA